MFLLSYATVVKWSVFLPGLLTAGSNPLIGWDKVNSTGYTSFLDSLFGEIIHCLKYVLLVICVKHRRCIIKSIRNKSPQSRGNTSVHCSKALLDNVSYQPFYLIYRFLFWLPSPSLHFLTCIFPHLLSLFLALTCVHSPPRSQCQK